MHEHTRVDAAEEAGHALLRLDLHQRVDQTAVLDAHLGLATDSLFINITISISKHIVSEELFVNSDDNQSKTMHVR